MTFTVGRVLLVLIFIISGAFKLYDLQATAEQIKAAVAIPDVLSGITAQIVSATGMEMPRILAIMTGVIEIVCGSLVAFNIGTRAAAFVLVLFTIAATFYFHAFWTMSGEAMQNNMIHALKNLSIIGGLLVFVVLGSWRPVPSNQM
jgi:putative oxidoreductase